MCDFDFSTGIDAGAAETKSQIIADLVKNSSLEYTINREYVAGAVLPEVVKEPYPIIVLINGTAGCGKGTFISLMKQYSSAPVYELSTVDPIRPVVQDLLWWQYGLHVDCFDTVEDIELDKDAPYRQFLSDVKKAWEKYQDGPNVYVIRTVIKLSTDRGWSVHDDKIPGLMGLPFHHMTKKYPMPEVIFVNVREPKNLDVLKHEFWNLGLVCLTMKMDGLEMRAGGGADSDLLVDSYKYDLTIRNKSTMDELAVAAFSVLTFLHRANAVYGTKVREYPELDAEYHTASASGDTTSTAGTNSTEPSDSKDNQT